VYLQNVTGLGPLEAGLLLLVPNVLMIVGNLATRRENAHVERREVPPVAVWAAAGRAR
jgi:hypothetical protein